MRTLLRRLWRSSRSVPALGALLRTLDRAWWARTIRHTGLVDTDFVALQLGRPVTAAQAIRRYVRGGHARGLSLNPLVLERLVSAQLPDADRVPALYAYLVADTAEISTSPVWSAPAHAAAHPDALRSPGGPVGDAWRRALRGETLPLRAGRRTRDATREEILDAARGALVAHETGSDAGAAAFPGSVADAIVWRLDATDDDGTALSVLSDVLAEGHDDSAALVCLGAAPADVRIAAGLLALVDGRVALTGVAPPVADIEAASPLGTLLTVRAGGARACADAVNAVRAAGRQRPSGLLWLSPTGTIASAGLVAGDVTAGTTAHPLLHGFPREDLASFGEAVDVAAIDSPVRAHLVGAAETPRTLLDHTVTRRGAPAPRTLPAEITTPRPAGAPGRGLALEITDAGPVVTRHRETTTLPDGRTVPRLRWAIRTAAPAGGAGRSWGDTHFARGIATALERLGQYVAVDARPATSRASSALDDVSLTLRGPHPLAPPPTGVRMLWIISHPDEITAEEVARFDIVHAASAPWAAQAAERWARPVHPLLQCTDTTRFTPSGAPRTAELVFVGTARGIARPAVIEPLRAGAPLRVYGPDWRGYIAASAIAATHVPNDELPRLYEAAGAVLNDHWPAMQREGFVSNRLFDVVAAGGRAISDDVEGIAELFGGAVRTYRSEQELRELVTGDLDALFPAEHDLSAISARIREKHSFDARAATLLEAALTRLQG
ncbi:hypothetical protein GCM10025768_10440 [Microbacterium pseudoresistens]|uniref:Spore protein YkvP/CgeB glycosyl transferase-like domain-containing protein n=1 Tax=Microbacterium pseudoresistens TaxID=640634 RepID=A0A7Y9EVX1_9MICO|nr:glycosyltransferase family 1 protein [Microbacterium pseudoresistens]NYD54947.1 hypothetical protein [Microbacterium pseudoresistens]